MPINHAPGRRHHSGAITQITRAAPHAMPSGFSRREEIKKIMAGYEEKYDLKKYSKFGKPWRQGTQEGGKRLRRISRPGKKKKESAAQFIERTLNEQS